MVISKDTCSIIFNEEHAQMLVNMADCIKLLETKGSDYGTESFKEAASVASIITNSAISPHTVAACLIGIKLARYGSITGKKGIEVSHESAKDTIQDLTNYVNLMERERMRSKEEALRGSTA